MVDLCDPPEPSPSRPDGPEDPSAGSGRFAELVGEGAVALRPFTMRVVFLAPDEGCARCQAHAYVEALMRLRPEVDCATAEISAGGQVAGSPVFCGSPGPDPFDVCADVAGHVGDHCGPGVTGRWSEREVPRAPDDLGDIR